MRRRSNETKETWGKNESWKSGEKGEARSHATKVRQLQASQESQRTSLG